MAGNNYVDKEIIGGVEYDIHDSGARDDLSSLTGRVVDLEEAVPLLNGNDVLIVADHTAVVDPDTTKIYREQGTNSYTDWMYDGQWKDIATYSFPGIDATPTFGSSNPVSSDGVAQELLNPNEREITHDSIVPSAYINKSNARIQSGTDAYQLKSYQVTAGDTYKIKAVADVNAGSSDFLIALFTTQAPAITVSGLAFVDEWKVDAGYEFQYTPSSNGYIAMVYIRQQEALKLYKISPSSRLDAIEEEIDGLENDVDNISGDVDDLKTAVDDIDAQLEELDISSIKDELSDPTRNLLDRSKITLSKLIWTDGSITSTGSSYGLSDYIAVNKKDIIASAFSASPWPMGAVYNSNKELLRVIPTGTTQYTYVSGDAFVRINFANISDLSTYEGRANYGQILYPYKAYSDSLDRLDNIGENVAQLQVDVDNKLDKIPTQNLVDPSKWEKKRYINASGNISVASDDDYVVSDYIEVNGQDIISNALRDETYGFRPWVAYDAAKNKIRVGAYNTAQYTYAEGDVYIRIAFRPGEKYANYGTTLVEVPFSDYAPVLELQEDVAELEDRVSAIDGAGDVTLSFTPNALYKVWNDINVNRQNVSIIGLSRLLAINTKFNGNTVFKNGMRFVPITPTTVSQIAQTNLDISVGNTTKQCVIRNTPASLSENKKPRILVIGDSVTSGYGANQNKFESWLPNQYWAYSKMFFEMDKIDNSDSGHDILFVGGVCSSGDFTISYKSVSRSVRVKAEGKGGAALQELYNPTWGDNQSVNPFYDETNNTFSILAYLANYRTMDDNGVRLVSASPDPHGTTVTGSDGVQYTIGQKITSQTLLNNYDVCTPTHVFMNLNHNTSDANFTANIANVVNKVKTELPNVVFAWLCIDSTGTNYPKDYPEFDQSIIPLTSLHTKNGGFFNYFHNNIENEASNIFLLGLNFVQPEAIDYPYTEIKMPNGYGDVYKIANETIAGRNYHPNNIAHAAWGYQLYAFIKWLINK